MKIILFGIPRTKKNSQQIITHRSGRKFIIQSKLYLQWEKDCLRQITGPLKVKIDYPVNLKVLIYKKDKRRSDLCNYLAAVQDMLVKAEVLLDDNWNIVASVDGSRLFYDKENPRCEIEIKKVKI